MKITLEVIPHSEQRLGVIGDWYFVPDEDSETGSSLVVRVSDTGDWRYNFLIARHEMDEAILCMKDGITTEMVDADQKKASPDDDPDSFSGYPGACLQRQHNHALAAEWVMAQNLDVDWDKYGQACEKIGDF